MATPTALHYVTVRSLHQQPLAIAARLRIPVNGRETHPAVILLHGSAGPSLREGGYCDGLNAAGIATLEMDQWAARGLKGGASGRPKSAAETLPDLYGARAFLAGHPAISASRIGVAGFSFGGVAAMLAATKKYNSDFLTGLQFDAIMAVYPATWIWNRLPGYEFGDLVDAPFLLVTGALDQYDNDPKIAETLISSLAPVDRVRTKIAVMPESHHGFDMEGANVTVSDPFGNQGKGGEVTMRYNPETTRRAHDLAVTFFAENLG